MIVNERAHRPEEKTAAEQRREDRQRREWLRREAVSLAAQAGSTPSELVETARAVYQFITQGRV